jgi:hypothetical protein
MRTAYSPKTHEELGTASAGRPYGHLPGGKYSDVDVCISRAKNGTYRCHVVASFGSSQGYDEEHGRTEVIGRGDTIREACADARGRASDTDMNKNYLTEALSKAEDEAEEAVDAA